MDRGIVRLDIRVNGKRITQYSTCSYGVLLTYDPNVRQDKVF